MLLDETRQTVTEILTEPSRDLEIKSSEVATLPGTNKESTDSSLENLYGWTELTYLVRLGKPHQAFDMRRHRHEKHQTNPAVPPWNPWNHDSAAHHTQPESCEKSF